ncbi:hypothetical protein CCDG5_1550 [[Clostridium] cellulosi]|jgi:Sigma-70, region 4.|uniref:HTH luxR-type domain-containing protein n=1 Tax=[Clostridium] cellulosi TaxID=29343 RepID=A0A078KTZ7_9FIRM|nr:MAG: helix-turn-helix domain-containing protein [[Clostridium] cellulosi]CDZ24660.1 hypothetical protein CCDG5_1550 [[Clostridium] cellulosi]
METIKWVETPPCRLCSGPEEYRRRYPCMGCEKLGRKDNEKPVEIKIHRKTRAELDSRNMKIAKLYANGLSYRKIAIMLGMPRATVQSAVKAAKRRAGGCL